MIKDKYKESGGITGNITQVSRNTCRLGFYSVLLSQAIFISIGHAGPTGGEVVGGSGSISQSGVNTTINQTTQNMAINWQSYNVNANERVQYIQPNSSSISLNRILSQNGSTIAGRIDANGQVILVNPNGIFFTPTSIINVGGIIASGLNIQPNDFMNGNYIFDEVLGTNGTVINSGMINASLGGNVALIGKQVKNDGLIVANLGSVNLAAGKQAVLTFDDNGLLGVRVSKEILQEELGIDSAVINSGEINAEGGRVLLTASTSQDVFSQAVNSGELDQPVSVVMHEDGSFTLGHGADVLNAGSIDTSTTNNDQNLYQNTGRIVLLGENVTSSGELLANTTNGNGGEIELHAQNTTLLTENSVTSVRSEANGQGGVIKILGDRVGLFDQSSVNLSGANGGGQVLIGGDYRGENSGIRNASGTFVGEQTQIRADAINNGDGGRVIIWGDDSAKVYGSIFARGGIAGGNGGFVETSAYVVDLAPIVDVSAVNGNGGEWLVDPFNITISNDTNSGFSPNPPGSGNDRTFTATQSESIFSITSLLTALGATNMVTIQTDTGGTPEPDGGNITVASDIDLNSKENGESTLNFIAQHDIIIDGNIYDSQNNNDVLNLILTANSNGGVDGGDVFINGAIDTNGGDLTFTGDNVTIAAPDFSYLDTDTNTEWTIGIRTAGGNIDLNASDIGLLTITNTRINTGGGNFATSGLNLTSTQNASALELRTNGGDVNLVMSGAVNLGADIDANGGNITIGFDDADNDMNDVFPASITVTALLDTIGANDTVGGNISLYSSGTINTDAGTLDARGGMATGTSGNRTGRNGGEVSLQGADITLGMVNTSGSNSNGNTSAGAGDAGTITLISTSATGDVVLNGMLTAEGGNGPGGDGEDGDAGNGKLISISAGQDVFANASLSSNGGAGPVGGDDGDGGDGGGVMIVAGRHVFINAGISSDGGNATVGSGTGGNADGDGGTGGGGVTLTATGDISINSIISSAGGNGPSGSRAHNGSGGDAGDVTVMVGNNLTLAANISAPGGDRTTGSNTGTNGADAAILIEGRIGTNITLNNTFTINDSVSIDGLSATINGLGGDDTLLSGETENAVWTIDGTDTGLLNKDTGNADLDIRFNQIESLAGNAGQDDFQFTANASATGTISGLVDGAAGSNDSLRFTGDTTDRVVQLGALTIADAMADPNLNITGIEEIAAQDAANNILIADNVANTWNISDLSRTTDGINDGSVGGVRFENFDNLTGNADTDEFLIDTTGSVARIDGGTGISTLIARDADNTWTISATNNRLAVTNGDTIYVNTFTNIDTLAGGNAADTFEFTGGSITGTAEGRAGEDIFILTQAITQGQLDGGENNDTFRINANVSGNSQLSGGTGDDRFDIANGVSVTTTLASGIAVLGGAGNDTLDLADVAQDVNWNITTSTGGGNITDTASTPVTITAFDEMENLIGSNANIDTFRFDIGGLLSGNINAGDSGDVFNFNGGTLTGTAYGEAGSDLFTVSQAISQGQLDGGTDNDTFNLNADVTGTVNGREGIDTFNITADIAGTLNGNAGNDSFNINASGLSITSLAGGTGSDTLNGNDSANIWAISVANSGTLVNDTQTTTFSEMENLTGGTDTDDFTVTGTGAINGVIDGGGTSANTLTGRDADNTWVISDVGNNLATTSDNTNDNIIYVTGFRNINTLGGGNAVDTFDISTTFAGDINGGDNNDIFNINATPGGTLNGNNGSDTFNIQSDNITATVTGGTGGTNTDTVTGFDSVNTNTWTIDTNGGGNLQNTSDTNIIFSDIENTTGGTGDDDFVMGASGTMAQINGGNGGTNTLTGRNATNTWTVSGTNTLAITAGSPYVNDFTNITTLTGGSNADIFNVDTGYSIVTLNGRGGADTFTINGEVTTVNGGDDSDDITVASTGTVDVIDAGNGGNTVLVSGTVSNSITTGIDGDSITVSGSTGSVNAGNGINTVTVNNGGSVTGGITTGTGDDTIVLADTGTGSVGSIFAGNGVNTVTINTSGDVTGAITTGINGDTIDISGSVTTIATGADNDDITISGIVSGLIDGGTGTADTLTITRTGNQIVQLGSEDTGTEDFTVNNVETIDATNSATGNTLRAGNGINTWEINAANSGEVTGVTFSNFANLSGGTGNDIFIIDAALSSITTGDGPASINTVTINSGGIVSGAITGGDGRDNITVNTGGSTGSISTAENQDTIWIASTVVTTGPLSGGSETDTLTVNTSGNIWALTNATDGTVTNNDATVDFTGFESLSSAVGSTDTLDYSLVTENINIDLNSLTGFGSIIGNYTNGGTYTASITGRDSTTNNWLIGTVTINATTTDGLNDGTVTTDTGTVTFENFNVLTGGDDNDTFTITSGTGPGPVNGAFDGTINGGGGSNTLIARDVDNIWTINETNSRLAYNTSITTTFDTIQNVTGGGLADTFTVNADVTNITTGNGNNSIIVNSDGSVNGAITGGTGIDTINVIGSANTISTGENDDSITVSGIVSGLIDGGSNVGDNDTLTINASGDRIVQLGAIASAGADYTVSNIELIDADSTTNNTLGNTLRGATGNNSWQVDADNDNDGDVNGTAFRNFANLEGSTGDDTFTVNASLRSINTGNGTNSITVNSGGNVTGAISGGTGIDTLDIIGSANTISTGENDDSITVSGTVSGLIDGGSNVGDNDILTINASGDRIVQLGTIASAGADYTGTNFELIDADATLGNTLGNTLRGATGNNSWQVDADNDNDGDVNGTVFRNFANLEGSTGDDTFTVNASLRSINTGNGTNSIAVNSGGNVTGAIIGGTGIDTFDIIGSANTISTGENDDSITVSGTVSGLIDGGSNTSDSDILAINAPGDRIVQLGNIASAGADYTVTNIELIDADNTTNNTLGNTLRGASGNNSWQVDADNDNDGDVNGIAFRNFANLEGSSGNDIFTVDAGLRSIIAGNGDNSITVNSGGSLTGAITGGTGIDTLDIIGSANTLSTGENDDSITVSGTVSGLIDGGSNVGDNDTLTINASGDRIVQLGNIASAGADYTVTNIELIDADTTTGNIFGNTLRGATGDNSWQVDADNDNDGDVNGTVFRNFANLEGSSGNDIFTVDAALRSITAGNGDNSITVNSDGSITGAITGGTGIDTLDIIGSANTIITGENDDSITVSGTVSGLIDGGSNANDNDTLTITATGNQIVELGNRVSGNLNVYQLETVTANGAAVRNELVGDTDRTDFITGWAIDGENTGELSDGLNTVRFVNFTDLTGTNGTDNFTLSGDATSGVSGLINGMGGNDSLTITATGNRVIELGNRSTANQNIYQIETLTASDGSINELISDSTATINIWELDGAREGRVDDALGTIVFNNIDNVTGGTGADNFTLTTTDFDGLITGGAGTDSLRITADGNRIIELGDRRNENQNIYQIEDLTANADNTNELISDSAATPNDWIITGPRSGNVNDQTTLTEFDNIDNVTGGASTDDITLDTASFAGLINGGEGVDRLSIIAAGNRIVEIGNRVTDNLNVYQLETLTAGGAVAANELVGDLDRIASTTSWTIDGANTGMLNDGSNTVRFTNFTDLTGANGNDNFTVSSDATSGISGLINGMGGNDSLTITAGGDRIVELGDRSNANLNVFQVEDIIANIDTSNELLSDSNAVTNVWIINALSDSTVSDGTNNTTFSNFSTLSGGRTADNFTVNSGATIDNLNGGDGNDQFTLAGKVNDTIDGGNGTDTVILNTGSEAGTINLANGNDFFTMTDGTVSVEVNAGSGNDVITIEGGTVETVLLGAGDDRFTINGGTVNSGVYGEDNDDTFVSGGGNVGLFDGGNGSDDRVTYTGAVTIALGDAVGLEGVTVENIEGIEAVNGTINARQGVTTMTTWTIDGINEGQVYDAVSSGQILSFSGFSTINGGSGVDNFEVKANGSISGTISGNGDNDTLSIDLPDNTIRTLSGQVNFEGGSGNDEITITGVSGTYAETYNPRTDTYDQLAYDNESGVTFDVNYRGTEEVNDNIQTTSLTINSVGNADIIELGTNVFGTTSSVAEANVNYIPGSKNNISLLALNGSNVNLSGDISIGGDLLITANEITRTGSPLITANRLTMDSVNQAGTVDNKLLTNVNELAIIDHSGSLFIDEQNSIMLTSISGTAGNIDITAAGSITSMADLQSGGMLNLDATNSVDLSGQNRFSGATVFNAAESIILDGANTFSDTVNMMATDNITLGGNIVASSAMMLNATNIDSAGQNQFSGSTTFTATDSIMLTGNNTFSAVTGMTATNDITFAGDVIASRPVTLNASNISLTGQNRFSETGFTATSNITLTGDNTFSDSVNMTATNDITFTENIVAFASLILNAGNNINLSGVDNQLNGELILSGTTININNTAATTLASVTARNLTINSTGNITGTGAIQVQNDGMTGVTTLTSEGSIILDNENNNVELINLTAANDATVTDSDGITLGVTTVDGVLNVTSNGDMGLGGNITATAISLTANDSAIVDESGRLVAETVTLLAATGIGAGSAINTTTSTLSVINSPGNTTTAPGVVNINNTGNVIINDLRNYGDITLSNTGNITLSVTASSGAIDANYNGNTNDPVYAGNVTISGTGGNNFSTMGVGTLSGNADITAENLYVENISRFGTQTSPVGLRVNDEFRLFANQGAVYYLGSRPRNVTTSTDLALLVIQGFTGISSQQLIEIETLGEIDQAIFTEVRNYNHDDVAILLPADQRYGHDDREEEDKQTD